MKKMSTSQQLKSNAKGFTLIEVLVAITLGVIVLGALYGIFISVVRINKQNTAKAELTQNARIALERITRDVRQAQRIVSTLPETNNDPNNPAPSEIIFQDGHDTTKIEYIRYKKDQNNLVREQLHYYFSENPAIWVQWNTLDSFGNPPIEIITESSIRADRIASLKFYGNKIIGIDLQTANEETTFTFQTQILGRNLQ